MRSNVSRWTFLGAFGALAACGVTTQQSVSPTPDATVVASVGTQSITQAQFDIRLQSVSTQIRQGGGPTAGPSNSAMVAGVRARVMESLITDAVIAQEAQFRGVAASDDQVNAEIAQDQQAAGGTTQLASQLADVGGSLDQLRDETRARVNEASLEDYFAQQRAVGVLAMLNQGQSFATLAKTLSDDAQSAATGGDLGIVSAAQLDAGDVAFKAAVLGLGVGQTTTAPVHDSAGYEILRVTSVSAQGRHVLRILVAAPQPYTVKERPTWFAQSVRLALAQLCGQNKVIVYIDADRNPCAALPTVTPAP